MVFVRVPSLNQNFAGSYWSNLVLPPNSSGVILHILTPYPYMRARPPRVLNVSMHVRKHMHTHACKSKIYTYSALEATNIFNELSDQEIEAASFLFRDRGICISVWHVVPFSVSCCALPKSWIFLIGSMVV